MIIARGLLGLCIITRWGVGNRHLPVFTFDFSGPHPRKVNMAQYLLVAVWSLGHMRLLWAFGVGSHTCIRTVSQKSRSTRLYPTLVTWWSSTKLSRNHHPLRIVGQQWCAWVTRIAGGVLVVSVINGELKEVCSAKVRKLGERVGQAWRLHVHPQDSTRAAYVNRKGDVKWNLQNLEVPTVEQCVKEDALEVQDIRELGLGWAWFVNDL